MVFRHATGIVCSAALGTKHRLTSNPRTSPIPWYGGWGASQSLFRIQVSSCLSKINEVVFGVAVDAVNEVASLNPSSLRPAPDVGGAVDTRHIGAIATVNVSLLMLLDTQTLFGDMTDSYH